MKRLILSLSLTIMALIGLNSCKTGNFPQTYGHEDMAYIYILSGNQYDGQVVKVQVDSNFTFDVKVQKAKQDTEKHNGEVHGIKPGTRHIIVRLNDQIIYEKDVVLSNQQTKIINL